MNSQATKDNYIDDFTNMNNIEKLRFMENPANIDFGFDKNDSEINPNKNRTYSSQNQGDNNNYNRFDKKIRPNFEGYDKANAESGEQISLDEDTLLNLVASQGSNNNADFAGASNPFHLNNLSKKGKFNQ